MAAPVVNPVRESCGRRLAPGDADLTCDEPRLLVEIPTDFDEMLVRDPALALEWRLSTRAIFEAYFARGYRAVDFLLSRSAGRGQYLAGVAQSLTGSSRHACCVRADLDSRSETTLARRPRHRAAAEDVQVDVEHRLAGVGVAVEDRPVAPIGVAGSLRERRAPSHHLADQAVVLGSELVEAGDVASRDDQHVRRRLRVDVLEGDDAVVLVDDGCRGSARR